MSDPPVRLSDCYDAAYAAARRKVADHLADADPSLVAVVTTAALSAARPIVEATIRAREVEQVDLIRLLFAVYETWWHKVGTTDPGMDGVCTAVEPYELRIRELLEGVPTGEPVDEIEAGNGG